MSVRDLEVEPLINHGKTEKLGTRKNRPLGIPAFPYHARDKNRIIRLKDLFDHLV